MRATALGIDWLSFPIYSTSGLQGAWFFVFLYNVFMLPVHGHDCISNVLLPSHSPNLYIRGGGMARTKAQNGGKRHIAAWVVL
jgi:hypothetical protein